MSPLHTPYFTSSRMYTVSVSSIEACHYTHLYKHFPLLLDGLWSTYSASVGVGVLRVQAVVVLDVLEGLVHQAPVAALVALGPGAVHQVLLAEGHQLASVPEVLALQGPGGAEGPAGTALALGGGRWRWHKRVCLSADILWGDARRH